VDVDVDADADGGVSFVWRRRPQREGREEVGGAVFRELSVSVFLFDLAC
jgi:hypothetical protein